MTGRRRVPLDLKGTDEQYFRTREIRGDPEAGPDGTGSAANEGTAAGQGAATPRDAVPGPVGGTMPDAAGDGPAPGSAADPGRDDRQPPSKAVVLSRIVPVGPVLWERLAALSALSGVTVDDLLRAARKRTVARFRRRIAGPDRPPDVAPAKGGLRLRIALTLAPDELARLADWYDPPGLDLGLGQQAVAPLLAQALQDEIAEICRALP